MAYTILLDALNLLHYYRILPPKRDWSKIEAYEITASLL